jgi:hypothetical protein
MQSKLRGILRWVFIENKQLQFLKKTKKQKQKMYQLLQTIDLSVVVPLLTL